MAKRSGAVPYVKHHKDGTVWAKGQIIKGVAAGYWEWFRKDGTKMRSGYFEDGEQVGEWTTYDRKGRVYKVTALKSKPAARSRATEGGIDRYLDKLPDDQRDALEKLRKTIRSTAPRAEECISYQLPAFRLDGKVLVYFGVSAKRCAFYPGSGTAVAAHKDDLKEYSTSKGTIRFQPAKPLPAGLVRKLVRFRIAENTAQ
jgi:uncharacterized protein YdhG (YjbR/CyaY superfamily)